jgi:predicted DNA-binding transcriptional regulator YafY
MLRNKEGVSKQAAGWLLPTTGTRGNSVLDVSAGVSVNQIILNAVRERRRIRFCYGDEPMEVEPHCYGSSANGTESMVGFELGRNTWRWFHVPWMTRVSLMSETFEPRSDYDIDQPGVAILFAQV